MKSQDAIGANADAALVEAIYATTAAPRGWPGLLQKMGAWMGADCGLMMAPGIAGLPPVPLFCFGLDVAPIIEAYPRHAGRAVFTHRALATGRAPGVFLVDELMPPAEQATSDFWRDMVAPTGLTSGLFCMIRTPDENERPVILNFYRRQGSPPYGAADVAQLESLFPHLRRALAVALDAPPRRDLQAGMPDLYDAIGAPCFLLGEGGAILHHNHAADVLLAARDGVSLAHNRLALWDRNAQSELDSVLQRIVTHVWTGRVRRGAELLARRPSGGAAMVLVATPLGIENPVAALAAPCRCALFVLEEKLRINGLLPERLRRLYGLTAAETEVALALASGSSPRAISAERKVTIDTVRSQVKAALAKTGARRQADLATLVNRLRF